MMKPIINGFGFPRNIFMVNRCIDKNKIYSFNSEKEMIEHFIETMMLKDPDMLIAWFGLKFDLPKLLDRACALDINPLSMSPIHNIKGIKLTKNKFVFKQARWLFANRTTYRW